MDHEVNYLHNQLSLLDKTIFLFSDIAEFDLKIQKLLLIIQQYCNIQCIGFYLHEKGATAIRRKSYICEQHQSSLIFPEVVNLRLNSHFRTLLESSQVFFTGTDVNKQDRILADRHGWNDETIVFIPIRINNQETLGLLILHLPDKRMDPFDSDFWKTYTQYLAQVIKRYIDFHNLSDAMVKAESAIRIKSAFLSHMSQEIRNPVNSIVGFSDLLADPDLTTDQREEFIMLITQSARSLVKIFDNIIDASKIQAGELNIKKEWVDWQPILNEMIMLGKNFEKSSDLKFNIEYPEKTTDLSLYIDSYRLKQVVSNLLENAFKYTQKGNVTLGYRFMNNNDLTIYVRDTGTGIAPEQKQNIFDFFLHSNSYTRQSGSAGLGLALAKNIVELLGGRLSFESQEGKGSTFYVTIPGSLIKQAENISVPENIETPNFDSKTILVVEDIHVNYMLIHELLAPTKAKVIWAKNGAEAIEFHKNQKIDLILMDLQMPIMNGYDAIKTIRAVDNKNPIIAQSAFAMNNEKEKCFQLGANDFITKPIRSKELIGSVMKYINKTSSYLQ